MPRNGGLGLSEAEPAVALKNHAAQTHYGQVARAASTPSLDLVVWP